jgi:hypothetical protein
VKLKTHDVVYDTDASHFLIRFVSAPRGGHEAISRERLYRTKADGHFWVHAETSSTGGGHSQHIAIPMTEAEARAWLKDRFGDWKRFRRLEVQVFAQKQR